MQAEGVAGAGSTGGSQVPSKLLDLRKAIQNEIAYEDPFCGELLLGHVSKPFVLPAEQAEAQSWAL